MTLSNDNQITSHSVFLQPSRGWSTTPIHYEIQPFKPEGLFGTKEEIEKQRFFIARSNQAQIIQAFADKEFVERAAEIVAWFQTNIRNNLPVLKQAIAEETCQVPALVKKQRPSGDSTFHNDTEVRNQEILQIWGVHDKKKPDYTYSLNQTLANCHCGIVKGKSWSYHCVEEKELIGQCVAIFEPIEARTLAFLTGIKPEELPDVLRHWRSSRYTFAYTGNPIRIINDCPHRRTHGQNSRR